MFSQKELNLEEHQLRERIHTLTEDERARYHQLEIPRLRQASTYLWLNALFPFGAHHLYLGRWGRALLSVTLTLAALLTALGRAPWEPQTNLLLASMLILAMVIIEVPQLMNARLLVQSHNNRVMAYCLQQCRKQAT